MKRRVALIIISVVMIMSTCTACSEKKQAVSEPDITQVRNICNLATLECYYHNVAKSVRGRKRVMAYWRKGSDILG